MANQVKSKAGRKRSILTPPEGAFDGIEVAAEKVGMTVTELRSLTVKAIQAHLNQCPVTAKVVARGVAETRLADINTMAAEKS